MMQPIKIEPVKPLRKFDETFKREAVAHWLTSGKSAGLIARELGIKAERLYSWRNRFAPADLQSRLDAARREVRHRGTFRSITMAA